MVVAPPQETRFRSDWPRDYLNRRTRLDGGVLSTAVRITAQNPNGLLTVQELRADGSWGFSTGFELPVNQPVERPIGANVRLLISAENSVVIDVEVLKPSASKAALFMEYKHKDNWEPEAERQIIEPGLEHQQRRVVYRVRRALIEEAQ